MLLLTVIIMMTIISTVAFQYNYQNLRHHVKNCKTSEIDVAIIYTDDLQLHAIDDDHAVTSNALKLS